MNGNQNNNQSVFLPPLDKNRQRIPPIQPGQWNPQTGIAFEEVGESLDRPKIGEDTLSISSIPDMWARPLLVDMVLRDDKHPLHESIKAEWKGMLAAIALADVHLPKKLKAELLDFRQFGGDAFISALKELIPKRTVYKLDNRNQNPWEKLYIFLLNGQPVGMTSPATFVCPSESGLWQGVPWYYQGSSETSRSRVCRLNSPIFPEDKLTEDEKVQLWLWLDHLHNQLNQQTGDSKALKQILIEYKNELQKLLSLDPNTQKLRQSTNPQYFGVEIALGSITALSSPIPAKKQQSSVRIKAQGRSITEEILFITHKEEISKQWTRIIEQNVTIHETISLLTFNRSEFERRYGRRDRVKYLTPEDIFEDQFYFLKGAKNLLPGALLPEPEDDEENITYTVDDEEYELTPLLPIKPAILQYLTSEEMLKRITLNPIFIGNQSGVRVSLTLPLSGGDLVISKDYPIEDSNALTDRPYLEIWPNFKAEEWKQYYVFYFSDRPEKTFQISFPETEPQEIHPLELKNFQITRLESFPDYIICQNQQGVSQGVILLKQPPKVGDQDPNKTWRIGVDFGTSFTNVYYQSNQVKEALTLTSLHLQVTNTRDANRRALLYDYFMSANAEKFPLSTVLTIKGNKGQERPIFDGRIFLPTNTQEFDPKNEDIKTDLKWSTNNPKDTAHNRIFLKHLALLVTAEAAKNHVRKIEWSVSYPSAFSLQDKNLYQVSWTHIIDDLNTTTGNPETKRGIEHQWLPPAQGKAYRQESLALAQYFADEEEKDLVYTTCIDMGGGTSDISIWLGNRLLHQCSLQLAGRVLFSQFFQQKPDFLNGQFNFDIAGLNTNDTKEKFYAKLDAILLGQGDKWLKEKRPIMDDNSDLKYILQLSALGISGLYYYIGLVLQSLEIEGKYDRKKNTPVYIGGNGSRILHWLEPAGTFSNEGDAARMFSRMFSQGSGYDDTRETTLLSLKPKAEVACGLVLDQHKTRLTGLELDYDDDLFAGEDCQVNGNTIEWNQRLRLVGDINTFSVGNVETMRPSESKVGAKVHDLTNLKEFFGDFHSALQDLRVKSIKPFEQYEDEKWQTKLWDSVYRAVEKDLLNMTGRKADQIRIEPPFILGLKALLRVLNEGI